MPIDTSPTLRTYIQQRRFKGLMPRRTDAPLEYPPQLSTFDLKAERLMHPVTIFCCFNKDSNGGQETRKC